MVRVGHKNHLSDNSVFPSASFVAELLLSVFSLCCGKCYYRQQWTQRQQACENLRLNYFWYRSFILAAHGPIALFWICLDDLGLLLLHFAFHTLDICTAFYCVVFFFRKQRWCKWNRGGRSFLRLTPLPHSWQKKQSSCQAKILQLCLMVIHWERRKSFIALPW